MMKFLFMLLFLMPLSFISSGFWFNQCLFMIIILLFFSQLSHGALFCGVSYVLGIDLLTIVMIFLSLWVCSLMILASEGIYKTGYYYNLYLFVLFILLISLFCTFASMNLFVFYLSFEMSLMPTLVLIAGWGYQAKRIKAGVYLLFYTSLPMMVSIFYYYKYTSSLDYYFLFCEVGYVMLYV